MRKLTFAQKLWLPLYLSLACLIALRGFDAWSLRSARTEARQIDVANDADHVVSLASNRAAFAKHAALTRELAQKAALEHIKGLRFGKDSDDTLLTDEPNISQMGWPARQSAMLVVQAAWCGSYCRNLSAMAPARTTAPRWEGQASQAL